MKLSDRCRKEARDFYLYDNKDCVEWKAADLLDECERMLVVGVEVTGDDFAEGIGRWRDGVKATLAKLRGDAQ